MIAKEAPVRLDAWLIAQLTAITLGRAAPRCASNGRLARARETPSQVVRRSAHDCMEATWIGAQGACCRPIQAPRGVPGCVSRDLLARCFQNPPYAGYAYNAVRSITQRQMSKPRFPLTGIKAPSSGEG